MKLPTILIVDDELHMLRLIALSLKSVNATLIIATSGREALRLIRERPIALALFDVHMQDIDGLTALKELRSTSTHEHLPVILLTAAGGSHIEARGRALGVHTFFRKPFSPSLLAACVRELLSLDQPREVVPADSLPL